MKLDLVVLRIIILKSTSCQRTPAGTLGRH